MDNRIRIVDYFPFFAPLGKEILELRINMLNNYVDEFVICESNKTQSGEKISYELKGIIKKLKLPKEKITIIELDIPSDEDLVILDIDYNNCYENNWKNITSVKARVRERMQKDALLKVLDKYDNNTVFIHSDSDEIIRPESIEYISKLVHANPDFIVKIPLVHLETSACLRVFNISTDDPKEWHGMFICLKLHLLKITPTRIRSNFVNPYPIHFITENNVIVENLGWHFSWMGNADKRKLKCKSWTHYSDSFAYLVGLTYNSNNTKKYLEHVFKEGDVPPTGDNRTVLKYYPIGNLPIKLFESDNVRSYLLPNINNYNNIFGEEYFNACLVKSDINEHLTILYSYATKCKHVTEMGTKSGMSTKAFLYADITLVSYDININDYVSKLFNIATKIGKSVNYIQADVKNVTIEKTDLLFIDTWHTYNYLKIELNKHSENVQKYIIIHNIYTYGLIGEDGGLGLIPAIMEFLINNPEWEIKEFYTNNNGLIIIKRSNYATHL